MISKLHYTGKPYEVVNPSEVDGVFQGYGCFRGHGRASGHNDPWTLGGRYRRTLMSAIKHFEPRGAEAGDCFKDGRSIND